MESNAVVAFVLAVLAVPGVTSLVTSVIRWVADNAGIPPKTTVYAASLVITGIVLATGSVDLPSWAGDPILYVGAWIAWASANAKAAEMVYDVLLSKLPGLTESF